MEEVAVLAATATPAVEVPEKSTSDREVSIALLASRCRGPVAGIGLFSQCPVSAYFPSVRCRLFFPVSGIGVFPQCPVSAYFPSVRYRLVLFRCEDGGLDGHQALGYRMRSVIERWKL